MISKSGLIKFYFCGLYDTNKPWIYIFLWTPQNLRISGYARPEEEVKNNFPLLRRISPEFSPTVPKSQDKQE